ncbi:hypothetical protein PG996_006191 [Apiospora saccharicola]|uniref:Uncharacterized protein n=1 Tax=Apiospora saccharicola TaxID=335842 RepID=A0ABR1VSN8_9PEZI
MSYETKFFSVDQAWVESLQWSTRTDVMSATAYGKIQQLMKAGIFAKELYNDAFMAKNNTERTNPMHEWFTVVVVQASLTILTRSRAAGAAENATHMPPKKKQALSATATSFVPQPPPALPSPAEMGTEFEKRCAEFSIRLSKK